MMGIYQKISIYCKFSESTNRHPSNIVAISTSRYLVKNIVILTLSRSPTSHAWRSDCLLTSCYVNLIGCWLPLPPRGQKKKSGLNRDLSDQRSKHDSEERWIYPNKAYKGSPSCWFRLDSYSSVMILYMTIKYECNFTNCRMQQAVSLHKKTPMQNTI